MVFNYHEIKAPLPGKILDILVSIDEEIKKGKAVLILEAMKMENQICCEIDGTVEEILCAQGDLVNIDQLLIKLK